MPEKKTHTLIASGTLFSAICIVISNMVGIGVFTSLGFQVIEIRSGFVLLCLWGLGGLLAMCGALCYAEMATLVPRSGGEYTFMTRLYHPATGFMSGFVSATAGFAAPLAIVAMAFGHYSRMALEGGPEPRIYALGLIVIVTLVHLLEGRVNVGFQVGSMLLKLMLILILIVAGLAHPHQEPLSFLPQGGDFAQIIAPPFGVSLVYVMFAYSGWNAATYLAEEVRNPQRNVPWALCLGTVMVMGLYLALNYVFLKIVPLSTLAGQVEVAALTGRVIFGEMGGRLTGGLIALSLVATAHALLWLGSRVPAKMGETHHWFQWFSALNARGVPARSVLCQAGLAAFFTCTGTFDRVMTYIESALMLSSLLVVLGLGFRRWLSPAWRTPQWAWIHPWAPLFFTIIALAMLGHTLMQKPFEFFCGLGTLAFGLALYAWMQFTKEKR